MLNIQSPCTPDFQKYEETINANGAQIYIDYTKYITSLNRFTALFESARDNLVELIRIASLDNYVEINSTSIIWTLIDYCGLNERDLQTKKPQGNYDFSLDQTKVLLPLKEKLDSRAANAKEGYRLASEIVDAYLQYKEYKHCMENARAKCKLFIDTDEQGWSGNLKKIDFVYQMKDTGRYYTKNDNIQNWNLNMVPSITVPKGYIMVWADFAQIDLRVAYHVYLKEAESRYDEIYKEETDKYRAIYRIMCESLGEEPDFNLFKEYRPAFKKAILSAIYNAAEHSLAVDMKNPNLAKSLYKYIHNNPGYKHFRKVLDRVIDFGIEVPVNDYFGFKRNIPLTASLDWNSKNQTINKGCNTPIQSTSNSIKLIWLEELLTGFEKYGFNRTEHVIPYLDRHDEMVFMIHESVIPYLWVFNEYMSIAIDDWDILELEPHIGLFYKTPIKELEDTYLKQVEQHKNEYSTRTVTSPRKPVYRPISDVVEIYTYTMYTAKEIVKIAKGDPNQFETEQQAEEWLREKADIENNSNSTVSRWCKYSNKYFVYSSKLNKYKVVPDFATATDIAMSIGSTFVKVWNTTNTGTSLIDDIYYDMDSSNSFHVMNLLKQMEDLNWTTDWVELK